MTHLKPRSTSVVIYQGDDMDRLAELNMKVRVSAASLQQAEDEAEDEAEEASKKPGRMGDEIEPSPAVEAARAALELVTSEYEAAVDEAAERALTVELQSIGRRRFRDLLLTHPPRKVQSEPDEQGKTRDIDHPDDDGWGVNMDTFPRALLVYRDGSSVTIAQPEFRSSADVEAFVDDELSDGDFEQMFQVARMLNQAPSVDPRMRRLS